MSPSSVSVLYVTGQTPLHCAMMMHGRQSPNGPINSKGMIQLLFSHGASLNKEVGFIKSSQLLNILRQKLISLVPILKTYLFLLLEQLKVVSSKSICHDHFDQL